MKRTHFLVAGAVLALGLLLLVHGVNEGPGREGVVADATPSARRPPRRTSRGASSLAARGVHVSSSDPESGPAFVWARRAASSTSSSPEEAAREHVAALGDVYGLLPRDVAAMVPRAVHVSRGGASVVALGAEVEGIEVFHRELRVVMDEDRELVALAGNVPTSDELESARGQAHALDVAGALDAAIDAVLGAHARMASATPLERRGPYESFALTTSGAEGTRALGSARVKPVFMTTPEGLRPAYYVEVDANGLGLAVPRHVSVVVDAADGAKLFENDLVAADSYRAFADSAASPWPWDGPHGTEATPHPTGTPIGYQAPAVAPALITLESAPFSRNDPWLPSSPTRLAGNNVWAFVDRVLPDGFQAGADLEVVPTSVDVFDHVLDPALGPSANDTQRMAATVQAFVVTNFLHDWFYDDGFDEAAGNAQASNFGRGGLEGDRFIVETQDVARRGSSITSVPADGASPRMQLGLYDGPAQLVVTSPGSLAGGFVPAGAATGFGSQDFDLAGEVVIPHPSGSTLGCEAFAPGTFTGKIALLDRGICGDADKALFAQEAGATGVILVNDAPGAPPSLDGTSPSVAIPVLSIAASAGDAWKSEVLVNGATITVAMKRGPALDRDAALDATIVAHEWAHAMTRRLVGDANGLSNSQGRALDEGWADFVALLLVVRPQDVNHPTNNQWQGVYAVGGHVSGGANTNGHYYGIRRVPYSNDSARNALTFKHITRGVALPFTHPVNGSIAGTDNAAQHRSAEVWASALFEAYGRLLNAYPFEEAQGRMKRYLVAALAATPIDPTFVEARDALLAVAAASDPSDHARFLQAFAKRGLGVGAIAPPRYSGDHVGVVESFQTGNRVTATELRLDDSVVPCDADGVLDVGESGLLHVTLKNAGLATLDAFSATVAGTSGTATIAFPNGNTMAFPSLPAGTSATRTLRVDLTATTGTMPTAGLVISLSAPSLPAADSTILFDPRVHYDAQDATTSADGFDVAVSDWVASPSSGSRAFVRATEGANRYWHGPAPETAGESTLTSPPVQLGAGGLTMSYRVRASFEDDLGVAPYYDGMVVEVSVDGGPFVDLATFASDSAIGYVGTIAAASNPLSGRPALAGMTAGFPSTWQTLSVNLPSALAGKRVRFRFRIGTNEGTSAYGVDLDDVAFTDTATPPFSGIVAETSEGTVCNRPPRADAGPDLAVLEYAGSPSLGVRTTVVLSGFGSFDADGDVLTYAWEQIAGPAVALVGGSTPAPSFVANVTHDATLVFALTVSDGVDEDRDLVEIAITDQVRAPVAAITGPTTVVERSGDVTLDGTGSSDPEGAALVYSWTQVDGPAVGFDASASSIVFTPPEVGVDTLLGFSLVVSNGTDPSVPSLFYVEVLEEDRPPTVSAPSAVSIVEGALATATATGTDADGTPLAYAWTQTAGPAVTLIGADTATVHFLAPDVDTATAVTLEVTVTSGAVTSAPAAVVFTVTPRPTTDQPPVEPTPRASSGGCSVATSSARTPAWLLALVGALLVRRRRRRV